MSKNKIHRIAFVGDIMQHDCQHALEKSRGFSYDGIVGDEIKRLFLSCDSVIGNLETIVDVDKKPSGFPNFNAHENLVKKLAKIGFTDLIVSNNHSIDQGENSFVKTVMLVEKHGIKTHGHKIFGVRSIKNSNKIFLNASTNIMNNGYPVNSNVRWFYHDDFIPSKSMINIAYIHVGTEYEKSYTLDQQRLYKRINKYGEYDAVFLVHSHVVGDVNDYMVKDNTFISNGLGNFMSQQKSLDKQKGIIVLLDFNTSDNEIINISKFKTENKLIDGVYKTVSKEIIEHFKKECDPYIL